MPPELPPISGRTRLFAVLGDPVEHSLSPALHNAAFEAAEIDARYVALRCPRERLGGLMHGLAAAGGGGNVTVPHKSFAADAVDVPSAAVRAIGACNTFWVQHGRLHGDNTDVRGFENALETLMVGSPAERVLPVGAGGAAAAALFALLRTPGTRVVVLNRSTERARAMVEQLTRGPEDRVRVANGTEELEGESFDVAVNATPLGLDEQDALPLPIDGAVRYRGALDMVYGPDETPWVRQARAAGLRAMDGKEMLLHQAAAAFRLWFERPPPLHAMRAALGRSRA